MRIKHSVKQLIKAITRRKTCLIEPPVDLMSTEANNHLLRAKGVRVGQGCRIYTANFSTEPYLVTIGDHVGISAGTQFITHDGAAMLLREQHPALQVLGTISVGNRTFIGFNAIILPNTTIGANCVIGAGAVVRGEIPDNSVVMGNPGKIIMTTDMLKDVMLRSPNRLDILYLSPEEREAILRQHFGLKESDIGQKNML